MMCWEKKNRKTADVLSRLGKGQVSGWLLFFHAYPLISGNLAWIWNTCYKEWKGSSIKDPL